jgi:hypothetical protein
MNLGQWPWHRVALVSVLWGLGVCGFAAWRVLSLMPDTPVAAVSAPLVPPLILAFGPPLVLALSWLALRRQRGSS